jgi:hypothetical protein
MKRWLAIFTAFVFAVLVAVVIKNRTSKYEILYRRIDYRMTEAKVIELLGPPHHREMDNKAPGDLWLYWNFVEGDRPIEIHVGIDGAGVVFGKGIQGHNITTHFWGRGLPPDGGRALRRADSVR